MPVVVNFFIPAPTIQFFGVGEIAVGVDPLRDAEAGVSLQMRSKVTQPNGNVVEDIVLDYGMTVSRETLSGVMLAFPTATLWDWSSDSTFQYGDFGFKLPQLTVVDVLLADLGPGDILEFSYEYSAFADTGFGETGVFAAIGDPFDLTVGGGRVRSSGGRPAAARTRARRTRTRNLDATRLRTPGPQVWYAFVARLDGDIADRLADHG